MFAYTNELGECLVPHKRWLKWLITMTRRQLSLNAKSKLYNRLLNRHAPKNLVILLNEEKLIACGSFKNISEEIKHIGNKRLSLRLEQNRMNDRRNNGSGEEN